jgi:hypothetical protein
MRGLLLLFAALVISLVAFVACDDPLVVAYYDFEPEWLRDNELHDLTGNGHMAQLHGDAVLSPRSRLNVYANLVVATDNASLVVPDLAFYGFGTFFAVWLKVTDITATLEGGKARTLVKSGPFEVRILQSLSSLYLDVNGDWNALMPLGLGMWFFIIAGFDTNGYYVNVVQSDVVHILLRENRTLSHEPHTGFVLGGEFTFHGLADDLYILRCNIAEEQMSHAFAERLGSVDYRFTTEVGSGVSSVVLAAQRAAFADEIEMRRDSRGAARALVGPVVGSAAAAVTSLLAVSAVLVFFVKRKESREEARRRQAAM